VNDFLKFAPKVAVTEEGAERRRENRNKRGIWKMEEKDGEGRRRENGGNRR